MKTLKEQIADKCIHFNGIMNKECNAGINYDEFKLDRPFKFPCLKQGGKCSHAKFRTEEEVDEYVKSIEDRGVKAMVAISAIKDHHTRTKQPTGKVPCQCGGELSYVVASVNGHVWAKCNTCGISFNE